MRNDVYYFHNIKANVLFSFNLKTGFDWLSVKGNDFSFYHNPETGRVWRTASYFPISVTRNNKPWGRFDIQRQKLHITTRGDFDGQLNAFVALLKRYVPNATVKTVSFKYVETCTRYEDKYFDEVSRLIKKAESRFFTNTKTDSFDKRIKGETWLTLGRELSLEKIKLNIKTYRFVEEIKTRERKISETVLPKIEIQIYKPDSLEEVRKIAVPIIKSFQEYIGFETESMETEPNYALIQDTLSLSHNQKLVDLFNENASVVAIKFPQDITEDDVTHEVACFLTPEARTRKEIQAKFNLKTAKLSRVLSTLNPYLEKRGNNAIGLCYQIDTDLIEQHLDNNKGGTNHLTKHKVNSNTSNKDKGNTSIVEVSKSKTGIYYPHIKVTKQKPKFKRVRITREKQVVKEHHAKITALPQTVDFHHLSVKQNSSTEIKNEGRVKQWI